MNSANRILIGVVLAVCALCVQAGDALAWRGWQSEGLPKGWTFAHGELRKSGPVEDLVSSSEYANFVFEFDWKLGQGGNSGVFYRGTHEYDHVYWSAPEYQLLDDANAADGKDRLTSAAAAYALYPSPAGVVRAHDQWNHARIVVHGNQVEHWLNGQKVVSYELMSEDWKRRVAASKFAAYPHYGLAARGVIAIQGDHDGALALRNMVLTDTDVPPQSALVDDPCSEVPVEMTDAHKASGNAYEAWMRDWLAVDWGQLCRYRTANAALPAATPHRVVFIGDSITDGWQANDPALFADDWLDRGISGQTSAQMLVRFRRDVIELHPAAVHIMAGTNDLAGNTGPESLAIWQAHIAAMVDLARANSIAVVLASIPPAARFPWRPALQPTADVRRMNEWLAKYAGQRGLTYVDYFSALAEADGSFRAALADDGVHPNKSGYAVMGPLTRAAVARALKRRLK